MMEQPHAETTYESEKIKASGTNLDKLRGPLIGGAIVNALRHPVEFLTLDRITGQYGEQGITTYEINRASEKTRIALLLLR